MYILLCSSVQAKRPTTARDRSTNQQAHKTRLPIEPMSIEYTEDQGPCFCPVSARASLPVAELVYPEFQMKPLIVA